MLENIRWGKISGEKFQLKLFKSLAEKISLNKLTSDRIHNNKNYNEGMSTVSRKLVL